MFQIDLAQTCFLWNPCTAAPIGLLHYTYTPSLMYSYFMQTQSLLSLSHLALMQTS